MTLNDKVKEGKNMKNKMDVRKKVQSVENRGITCLIEGEKKQNLRERKLYKARKCEIGDYRNEKNKQRNRNKSSYRKGSKRKNDKWNKERREREKRVTYEQMKQRRGIK